MRDDFIIERQGKRYALYAGLLEEAHEEPNNLHSIQTVLIQIPEEKNDHVAIVQAVVTLDTDLPPEERRQFSGIGDASPRNVSRNIAEALIRMAETRAKARAMRDAVNVGVTAFEELAGDDASQERQERRRAKPAKPAPASEATPGAGNDPATEKQLKYLRSLCEDWFEGEGRPEDAFYDATGKRLSDLTIFEANRYINDMGKSVAPTKQ